MKLTLRQLADITRGTILAGDSTVVLTGAGVLRFAEEGELSFFDAGHPESALQTTRASAVLVGPAFSEKVSGPALVACADASAAFAEVLKQFTPPPRTFRPGIHPSAVVHPAARLSPGHVSVGPRAVVEAGAEIGDGTEIGAGSVIGEDVKTGRDCIIRDRVTIYDRCLIGSRVCLHSGVVIGADGFGYEFSAGRHQKVEQTGIVQIDDDVEIGANSTVDRARFGRTRIGSGTRIGNLVMIAHNCVVGSHVIIMAQAGIAGSARIGDHTVVHSQAGVAGHLETGPGTVITAKSAVTRSLPEGGVYSGHPVSPSAQYEKQQRCIRKLPSLYERLKRLERREAGGGRTAKEI